MRRHVLLVKSLFVAIFLLIQILGVIAQDVGSIGDTKAYPNPFREQLTIEYQLQQDGNVEIVINNILGQKIKTLLKEDQQAGSKRVKWDGLHESGNSVSNGMYYITLRTPTDKKVVKVMKTK